MPFDAKLVLLNGLVDVDGAISPLDAADLAAADAEGAQIVDLKETGVKGLAAVVVCTGKVEAGTDVDNAANVVIVLEASDALDFAVPIEKLTIFGDDITGSATIWGVNVPGVFIRRFATAKRYLRIRTDGLTGNMGLIFIMLSPYPFKTL